MYQGGRSWQFAVLLLGTAVLYLWNLGASGWANGFYAAAVQAGSQNWTALLFGSSDAANAITVDKTPAALWVMGISARLFGFNAWSMLVPQALMGVAAVAVLYAAVRRVGRTARRAAGGCGAGADTRGGADVPVQQPRCAAGADVGGRRLRGAARAGTGQQSVVAAVGGLSCSGSGSWPR